MIGKSYEKPADLTERLGNQLSKYEAIYGRNEEELSVDTRFNGQPLHFGMRHHRD